MDEEPGKGSNAESNHSDGGGDVRISVGSKSALAGITVTTGAGKQNATTTHGGAVINSIRVGTSGRSIIINQQPLMKKPIPIGVARRTVDEEDDGPPVLQPQVIGSSGAGQQAPILAIPQPKPNSVVLVKTPDGRTLLISNKPQTPGGPCVITYQYIQLPLTGQAPQATSGSTGTPSTVQRSDRIGSINRQPSLIRPAAAAVPSVMNDHVYRGSQSPTQSGQNQALKRSQGGVSGSGPGRWLSVQPAHQRRSLYQPQPAARRSSSWYRDEYFDEGDDEPAEDAPYFDEYTAGGGSAVAGGGEYFMEDEEGAGGSPVTVFRGNDGPPELEPMGAVPILRAVSGYGGHAYRRVRPSGSGLVSSGSYVPGRYSAGTPHAGGYTSSSVLFNRRSMEFREKVDRRRVQECKSVLNRVVDEVVEMERQRKREEAKHRPKKSRTEYWRQYRLKRKFKRMQDDELNKRADVWCREINKRRDNIRSMINREIQRHITEAAVSKVVNERVRLGWTMPSRPLKRAPPIYESPLSSYVLSASNKRSRYESQTTGGANMHMDYVVNPSAAPATSSTTFPFSGAGLYESGVIYGEPGVVEETIVDGVSAYYKPDSQQQHDEDQRAAEAIMGLAAAGAASSSTTSVQQQEDLAFEQQLHCICRTPLDRSKFYVMCDMCGGWFHGKCVGITEKKSRTMSTWACQDCQKEKERTQELYCICRTPYDETQPYICCDACDGWYHCSCVGVSPSEADALPSFFCPNCLQASQGAAAGGVAVQGT